MNGQSGGADGMCVFLSTCPDYGGCSGCDDAWPPFYEEGGGPRDVFRDGYYDDWVEYVSEFSDGDLFFW